MSAGTTLASLSKLLSHSTPVADDIIPVIRLLLSRFPEPPASTPPSEDLSLDVKLWTVPGVHELLASLGLDLMGVGETEVTLRAGKTASLRVVSYALQALLALFGKSVVTLRAGKTASVRLVSFYYLHALGDLIT